MRVSYPVSHRHFVFPYGVYIVIDRYDMAYRRSKRVVVQTMPIYTDNLVAGTLSASGNAVSTRIRRLC